ncbi:uncharacterized protein LOC136750480 [Amia ocellicauda]|uniref:uncharacterized protein LOC136750480 n=1 Tax=Amia ocellicauda TaxID=2972642 RepID=UPI0034639FCD
MASSAQQPTPLGSAEQPGGGVCVCVCECVFVCLLNLGAVSVVSWQLLSLSVCLSVCLSVPVFLQVLLPEGWKQMLPAEQLQWVSKALFTRSRFGKLVLTSDLCLWWFPPQPCPVYRQPPASPSLHFARPLFLWMPYRMWAVKLTCIQPQCEGHRLTGAGLYKMARQVLSIKGWLSCDYTVLSLMREHTLGNSATRLCKQLQEQHSEAWQHKTLRYLADCEPFVTSAPVVPSFRPPPPMPPVPGPKWLLAVYDLDVLERLAEVKAQVTSVFGSILKLDSTKKLTRKLTGAAAGTASWATNVGNEFGQVLNSVLMCGEGEGLQPMAAGLVEWYGLAGEAPPQILYVDWDCCSVAGRSKGAEGHRRWSGSSRSCWTFLTAGGGWTPWACCCWTTSGSRPSGRHSGPTSPAFRTPRGCSCIPRQGSCGRGVCCCQYTAAPVDRPPWSLSTSTWPFSSQAPVPAMCTSRHICWRAW